MKNDLEKIKDITGEMVLNDMLYKKMQFDLEIVEKSIVNCSFTDDKDVREILLDESYFFRRVLSVLANEDIPFRACIGLFVLVDVLPTLYDEKEDYIGESDSDSDIYKYVIEYGYRNFDKSFENGSDEFEELFEEALDDYDYIFGTEEETDENE